MNALQKDYNFFRSSVLSLLWRQWTALGVSGQVEKEASSLIDPEALLLVSLSLCRYDARLFDEIIDWLKVNGEFINVQRLTALQAAYSFASGPQLSAVAEYLSLNSEYHQKWHRLSESYISEKPEPLFYTAQGKQLPVGNSRDDIFLSKGLIRRKLETRNLSRPFPAEGVPPLLLNLRALMGISARCEMLCILAGMTEVHAAEAARLATYNRKTAQNALREMSRSGFVEYTAGGREIKYRANQKFADRLFPIPPKWIFWAPFYKGLELLSYGYIDEPDGLLLSAHFRRTAKEAQLYFEESKTGIYLTDPSRTPGEEYCSVFLQDLGRLVQGYDRLL